MAIPKATSAPAHEVPEGWRQRAETVLSALVAADVETPALVVDEAAMRENARTMAARAAAAGLALRPHAKTHKSRTLALMQRELGALGVCVTKLSEAEALAPAGVPLLLTAPVVARSKLARLAALAGACDLMAVVDTPEGAHDLAAACGAASTRMAVLVDLDTGLGRTGAASPDAACAVAAAIASTDTLEFAGVQAYAGHLQHIGALADRRAASADVDRRLEAHLAALRAAGHTVRIVTGGGTGTASLDMARGLFNELQVGSYLFGDVEYEAVEQDEIALVPALYVATQVVSANQADWVTLDAGSKCLSLDGPLPRVAAGAPPGAAWSLFGDEFGRLTVAGGRPALGERVLLVMGHCDPTINAFDAYTVVAGDGAIRTVPIEARGASV